VKHQLYRVNPRAGLVAILGFCIGLPLLSALVTGSIDIPHNDDWAYYRIAFHLAETGTVQLVGWNEAMLLGHLAWAMPIVEIFGHTVGALVTLNVVISGVGLVLTYLLARRFLPVSYSLLVAFLVGIFAGFAALVTTFMTDPGGNVVQLGCLVLGVRVLDRRGDERLLSLIACLLVGVYAFTIREFAVAAPIAVLVALAVVEKREGRPPRLAVVGSSALVAACAGLYSWRHTFAGDSSHYFGLEMGSELVVFMTQSAFSISLALLPAALFVVARNGWTMRGVAAVTSLIPLPLALFTVAASENAGTCCVGGSGSVFVGNILTERGVLGNQVLTGIRPTLFPAPIWWILSAGAVVGACLIVSHLHSSLRGVRRTRPPEPAIMMLATYGALTAGAVIFRAALGGPTFDRYLTPLVVVGAIVLFRGQSEPRWGRDRPAFIVTAALALVSVILVSSGHAFDSARWHAAEIAVASGIPAKSVDGGFEWVGFHYRGRADRDAPNRLDDLGPGYLDLFSNAENCAIVAASTSADPELEVMDSVEYRTLLGLNEERIWIYRFGAAC
jgi:hypothetical protein